MHNTSLRPYVMLRAGGEAERLTIAQTTTDLAEASREPITILGWGSNVLPSDDGIPGHVVINQARQIVFKENGTVVVDTGFGFQELFLKCAQRGLGGLEYAVGIPGTVGGALASNAGAYRSSVSEFIQRLEVCRNGVREWVDPTQMQFKYRDSILRSGEQQGMVVLKVEMQLPSRSQAEIYNEARDYQRQRIAKQPPSSSAGSFFKNVNDHALADRLETLTAGMKQAGVVPAGYLMEAVGLKGKRHGGAMFGQRHANFMLNVRNATAFEIRSLALFAKLKVQEKFGVELEEEALYIGDWSRFIPTPID